MSLRTAFLTIAAVMLTLLSACSSKDEDVSASDTSANESSASQISDESEEEIKTTSSSVSSPLSFDVWGSAAKYSTSEQKYYDLPVKITGIVRGNAAKDEIRTFMDQSDEYTYKEPADGQEWVLAEYEICLDGFPVDEGGTDCSIVSFVLGTDGGYIQSGGENYDPVTINIIDDKYYFEGNHKGKIAFTLPKKCQNYLISAGEYDEDRAYFSVGDKAQTDNS